jgi:hypothetical protein
MLLVRGVNVLRTSFLRRGPTPTARRRLRPRLQRSVLTASASRGNPAEEHGLPGSGSPHAGQDQAGTRKCEDCGALIGNIVQHQAWHWRIERQPTRATLASRSRVPARNARTAQWRYGRIPENSHSQEYSPAVPPENAANSRYERARCGPTAALSLSVCAVRRYGGHAVCVGITTVI